MMEFVRRLLIGALSVLFLFLSACQKNSGDWAINEMSRYLEIDLSAGRIISQEDTHGGFHGDGDTFIIVEFEGADREQIEEEIAAAPHWNLLPMIGNTAKAAYGKTYGVVTHIGGVARKRDGELFFPDVSRGYYCFYDRQSADPHDDTELFGRYSWNFILALYDSETGLLYYFKIDT